MILEGKKVIMTESSIKLYNVQREQRVFLLSPRFSTTYRGRVFSIPSVVRVNLAMNNLGLQVLVILGLFPQHIYKKKIILPPFHLYQQDIVKYV
jgi:hypothetical protein